MTDPSLGDGRLKLSGVVKWVVRPEEAKEGRPAGMGIRFLFPDPGEEDRLTAFVTKLMRQALGPQIAERLLARGRLR